MIVLLFFVFFSLNQGDNMPLILFSAFFLQIFKLISSYGLENFFHFHQPSDKIFCPIVRFLNKTRQMRNDENSPESQNQTMNP